jgi:heme-degrading monooxygenase HmoA
VQPLIIMAITEIALLQLSPGVTSIHADLRTKLTRAKEIMQDYTGRTFYYFQQCEDPSYFYVVGEWESLEQHMNVYIPSEANQALLKSLGEELSVVWLLHIDTPHAALPLPKTDVDKAKARNGELVISVVRHFIKDGESEKFQQTFESHKDHLQNYLTEGMMGGGWRIDKKDGKDEWVLLCPFKSVQQHTDFASTDEFEKYGQIRDHIDGAEIKHGVLLDI